MTVQGAVYPEAHCSPAVTPRSQTFYMLPEYTTGQSWARHSQSKGRNRQEGRNKTFPACLKP